MLYASWPRHADAILGQQDPSNARLHCDLSLPEAPAQRRLDDKVIAQRRSRATFSWRPFHSHVSKELYQKAWPLCQSIGWRGYQSLWRQPCKPPVASQWLASGLKQRSLSRVDFHNTDKSCRREYDLFSNHSKLVQEGLSRFLLTDAHS